jgi:hypothetical protein
MEGTNGGKSASIECIGELARRCCLQSEEGWILVDLTLLMGWIQ